MKRYSKRYIKIICLVAILFILFLSRKRDDYYENISHSNDYANKIHHLENNIEIIFQKPDFYKKDLKTYEVLSDSDNNKLFTDYDRDHSKFDPSHKSYFIKKRDSAVNDQKFFLINEYTTIGNTHKYCDHQLDKEHVSKFKDKDQVNYYTLFININK